MSPHERTVQVSRPIMPKRKLREYCRRDPGVITKHWATSQEYFVRGQPLGGIDDKDGLAIRCSPLRTAVISARNLMRSIPNLKCVHERGWPKNKT